MFNGRESEVLPPVPGLGCLMPSHNAGNTATSRFNERCFVVRTGAPLSTAVVHCPTSWFRATAAQHSRPSRQSLRFCVLRPQTTLHFKPRSGPCSDVPLKLLHFEPFGCKFTNFMTVRVTIEGSEHTWPTKAFHRQDLFLLFSHPFPI